MRWLTVCLTCHLILCSAVAFCADPKKSVSGDLSKDLDTALLQKAEGSITLPAKSSVSLPAKGSASLQAKSSVFLQAEGSIVREAGPPIYYLKNKDGRLVPVVGFEYEDFMKLLRQGQVDLNLAPPALFTIDQTELNGSVEDGQATFHIQLKITTRQDGLIRIPVGLAQAIMREDLKYKGEGSAFLDYDAKKKEYVVWVEGKKDQEHELLLSVAISTATIGLDTRLRFDAPRSTRSKMALVIPETGLDLHAPIGSRLSTKEEAKKTRITLDSVRGEFQLLWHKPPTGSSNAQAVVEVSGEIVVNIGSLDMTCEALLNVQGRGMPLDRFRIRLPKGTTDYQVSDGDYQVIEVKDPKSIKRAKGKKSVSRSINRKSEGNGERSSDAKVKSRIIEVRLSRSTLEPVLLRITTTRPLEKLDSPDWIEPVGFEVIGAVRQWGHVATVVGEDHFVSWAAERGIRRVDSLPSTMNVPKPAAVFEYYSAPFLLKSRIAPRRTRISVEPEHLLLVGANQLQIDSTLHYTIRGKSVLSLELDLRGWEQYKIGPETLVNENRIVRSPEGFVTVELLRPTIGRARLTLQASRAAPQQETKLEVAFPRPVVDSPGPAVVVVLPDDNVKLLPDAAASTGLSRLQATPSIRLPVRQQPPLFYRGDAGQATFSAERSIHERQVSVDIHSTVTLDMLTAYIKQSLIYQIDHESSDQIVLDVPKSLLKLENLEFLVDGVPVEETVQEDQDDASQTVPVVLTLKSARIGKCVVTVRYSLNRQLLIPNTQTKRRVPLVLPSAEPITHHTLSILSPLDLTADVQELPKVKGATEKNQPTLEPMIDATLSKSDQTTGSRQNFNATGRLKEIVVLLSMEKRHKAPSTTISRAFFQTWVTEKEYLNRALFQFRTQQKQMYLTLPAATIKQRVRLLLNGNELVLKPLGDRRYLITFPDSLFGVQQLELRWSSRPSGESRSVLPLDMPKLGEDGWIGRWYWQLLLPTDLHLLGTPHEILSESVWKWNGAVFQRTSLMETGELEAWVGAKALSTDTPTANAYLFSSFGEPTPIDFRIASRSLIVLISSGLVLLGGFLLIYMPVTRHPGSLLVLGVVLGSFGVVYPEPMLLGLQASSIGVILVGLTAILKRRVSRPRLPTPIPIAESGGSSILDRDSTQRQVVLPHVVSHQETTETKLRSPE